MAEKRLRYCASRCICGVTKKMMTDAAVEKEHRWIWATGNAPDAPWIFDTEREAWQRVLEFCINRAERDELAFEHAKRRLKSSHAQLNKATKEVEFRIGRRDD